MRLLGVALLLCVGCAGETGDDDGGGGSTSAASTGAATTTGPGTTGDGGDDSGGDGGQTGDDAPGDSTEAGDDTSASTGMADDATSDAEDTSADTNGGACDPDSQPNECLSCVVEGCCNQVVGCNNDTACACLLECHVINGNSIGNCKSQCDADDTSVGLYNGVYFCGQMVCLGVCDWNVG